MILPLLLVLAAMPLIGCGDDSDDGSGDGASGEGDGDGQGDTAPGCGLQENCTGDEVLEADLTVDGADGNFSVQILTHNALSIADNEWMVMILDGDGEPVEGAEVSASTWSVDCMHVGPTQAEELTSNADGHVMAKPTAGHGGPWNAVFDIVFDGAEDQVVVPLCVPGDGHGGASTDDAGAGHEDHEV